MYDETGERADSNSKKKTEEDTAKKTEKRKNLHTPPQIMCV